MCILVTIMSVMPQTNSNTLAHRISNLMRRVEPASQFEILRLWGEADKLARVEPAEASIIKALISALKWDVDEIRYWCKNALSLDNAPIFKVNASSCYRMIGEIDVANELAEAGALEANDDPGVMDAACEALFASGHISKAKKYALKHADSSDLLRNRVQLADKTLEDMMELNIAEKQLQIEIKLAAEVAFQERFIVSNVVMKKIDFFDGDSQLSIALMFAGDIHRELSAEAALACRFGEEPDWDPLQLDVHFKYFNDLNELSPA